MRIIYAYELDAANINSQSGYPFSILQQLERHGAEVIRAFPIRRHVRYLFAPKYLYHRRGRIYRPDREPAFLPASPPGRAPGTSARSERRRIGGLKTQSLGRYLR